MPKDKYGREQPVNPVTGEVMDLDTGKWYAPIKGNVSTGISNVAGPAGSQNYGGYGNAGLRSASGGGGTNAQYRPQQGETFEAWQNRLRTMARNGDQMAQSITLSKDPNKLQQIYNTGDLNLLWDSPTQESEQARIDRQAKEFYARMTAPLDYNDPEVKQAIALASNAGQKSAAGRGIRGGLSDAGIAKMAMDSVIPIAQSRREQGLRALAMSSDRDQYMRAQQINAQYRGEDMARRDRLERWNENNAEEQKYFGYATQALGTVGSLIGGASSMGGGGGGGGVQSYMQQPANTGGGSGYNNINVSNGSATYMRPPYQGGGY